MRHRKLNKKSINDRLNIGNHKLYPKIHLTLSYDKVTDGRGNEYTLEQAIELLSSGVAITNHFPLLRKIEKLKGS